MGANGSISQDYKAPGEDEIIQRLSPDNYSDPEVTKELYEFGSQLLNDRRNITNSIDTKAGVFAGFVGALIVVVVSTFSGWKDLAKDFPIAADFLFLGLIALLLAAFYAVQALRVRVFQELDEKNLWFAPEYLKFPDQLLRYYLIAMYRSVVSHDSINDEKAKTLMLAQRLALTGAFLLAIPLLWETWQLGIGHQLHQLSFFLSTSSYWR
jgi:hypothetical protein